MRAHYKTRSGRLTFEVEGQSTKELFRGIAELQNVFEADETCGCCGSAGIQYRVRTLEEGDYYELWCSDCTATLTFGQLKQGGGLFPKRKDTEGLFLPNRGWRVYRGPAKSASTESGRSTKSPGLFSAN